MNSLDRRLRELEKQAGVSSAMVEVMCLNYFYGDKGAVKLVRADHLRSYTLSEFYAEHALHDAPTTAELPYEHN